MNAPALPSSSSRYEGVAGVYDLLASLYSAGGIARAKKAHVEGGEAGHSWLYAGAGTAAEAVEAASRGVHVVVADLSPAMIARARKRFAHAELGARFVCADVLNAELGVFDAVVAPFFLNVFGESELPGAMGALARRVRRGGALVGVDFRAPSSNRALRAFQKAYYLPPLALFRLLANNPWHRLYDYAELAEKHHPQLRLRSRQLTWAWGMPLFETLTWEKQ